MKIRLLTAIFLLAAPLQAADVAREIPGAAAFPLALPPMNLGVEVAPMAGDVLSGGAYSLTPAAPTLSRPAALSPENFSSMPLTPQLPLLEFAPHPSPLPNREREPEQLSKFSLSERLKKQALGLQLPLKSLASWSLGGAKSSAEKGRGLSDDLWRLLFSAHSQDQRVLGKILTDSQSGGALGPEAISFPNQTGLSRDSSQGHDPVVAGIGPIPAPDASLSDIEIFKENSRLNRENILSLKEDHSGFMLSSIRQISGPPVLIFMRVARRLLDFTLFEKIGTIYRLIAPVQERDDSARWEFFEPTGSASSSPSPLMGEGRGEGDIHALPLIPTFSPKGRRGLRSGAMPTLVVPELFSLPNESANLWLFLSFLPILIAGFAYRRSFL